MQVFFCMVDKKKSCPMRGRKKKRAGAAETPGAGDKMRDPQTEYRGAGAAETAGCGGCRDSGAAGESGAGQGSG